MIDTLCASTQNISFALSLLVTPRPEAWECINEIFFAFVMIRIFFFQKEKVEKHFFRRFAPGYQAAYIGGKCLFVGVRICVRTHIYACRKV